MESSDMEGSAVDCNVGAIVWVRRRNGSWWPGKILGSEELSAAHLMSPRSGTPVKLLGREDASVDWYNLERSKRVKPFRCGEFDDCIERAESSLGMPPKKREKYARREDAILHALELEKQLLETNGGLSGCSDDAGEKELVVPSECLGHGNGKHANLTSHAKKIDSCLEDKSSNHPLCAPKVQEGSELAGNDNKSEIIPRMRGLQDLGPRIAPSKRKLSSSMASNGFGKPELDYTARSLPGGGLRTENTVHDNSKSLLDKKKKLHEMLTDESVGRRRDRHRPLVQVLQSSAKLPVHHSLQGETEDISFPVSEVEQTGDLRYAKRGRFVDLPGESRYCSDAPNHMEISSSHFEENNCPQPAFFGVENSSESTESTETDSSGTDSLDSDGDMEMVALSDADVVAELEPKTLVRSGRQVQYGSMTSLETDDLALASDMSPLSPRDPISTSVGVSKWQLKGKRNNRGLAKRSTVVTGRRVLKGAMYGTNFEERESYGCDEPDLIESNFRAERGAFDNRGYLLPPKSSHKALDGFTHNIIDWEDLAWNDQPVLKGYWEDSSNYFDPVIVGHHNSGGRMKSMLVDVDLKVQSSYQREHVPMISLMSKLNGQAIVGHPIQIEALECGSSDFILSAADGISPDILDNDTVLSPTWRTARRTANFRVPRSHPSATLDGDDTAEHFQYADQKSKAQFKKLNVRNCGHKATTMKKSPLHASRPPFDRKFSRKPPKKISLSSSQKLKTLSSIGTNHKLGKDSKHGTDRYRVDGLMKGDSGLTTVACIPVKLVFSRLYEELVGRHQ